MAEALNSIANSDLNSNYLASMTYEPRTAMKPVICGDRLVLSILFTNANTGVNPVDLHLHFQIVNQYTPGANQGSGTPPGHPNCRFVGDGLLPTYTPP